MDKKQVKHLLKTQLKWLQIATCTEHGKLLLKLVSLKVTLHAIMDSIVMTDQSRYLRIWELMIFVT